MLRLTPSLNGKRLLAISVISACIGGILGSIPPLLQFRHDMQRIERQVSALEARSWETGGQIDALLPRQTDFTTATPK